MLCKAIRRIEKLNNVNLEHVNLEIFLISFCFQFEKNIALVISAEDLSFNINANLNSLSGL